MKTHRHEIKITTRERFELVNITREVETAVRARTTPTRTSSGS